MFIKDKMFTRIKLAVMATPTARPCKPFPPLSCAQGRSWKECCSGATATSPEPWLVWLSGLSMDWEPKGLWLDSRSGHMPGLQARSPGWGEPEATTLLSLSSPPLSLKMN